MKKLTKLIMMIVGVMFAMCGGDSFAQEGQTPQQPFEFIAIGDMPYDVPQDYERFDRLIAAINAAKPVFSIHVGDIKSGSSRCSDEIITRTFESFQTFEQPLIYTPGDNEWTDCHREKCGGYDPLERLAYLRKLFFARPESLGKHPMALTTQQKEGPFKKIIENTRWSHGGVTFVTLHMVGSNNNLGSHPKYAKKAIAEYLYRNDANLAWLSRAFAVAKKENHHGIVIAMQANPFFEEYEGYRTGYNDFLALLEKEVVAFGKPVLLIHGETHHFRIDMPMMPTELIKREGEIGNFIRLETFGAKNVHAVRVIVDPQDQLLFSFKPLIVPENLRYTIKK